MKLHHLGYAVRDLARAESHFSFLGYKSCSEVFEDTLRNVKIKFLSSQGTELIELVEPLAHPSPVDRFVSKSEITFYHLAFEVTDIHQELERCLGQKHLIVAPPAPAIAFENRLVAFVFSKTLGLYELIQL